MKKGGGKSKGSSYERSISRKLSEWITGNTDELVVWRSASSGAISTIAKKKGKNAKFNDGDFTYFGENQKERELFNKYFFDSKCLGNVHIMLINPKNQKSNQLFSEWKKVCEDAWSSNKHPVMLVKATNDRKLPEFIIFSTNSPTFIFGSKIFYDFDDEEKYNCFIVLQDEFFERNTYKDLLNCDWKKFEEKNG